MTTSTPEGSSPATADLDLIYRAVQYMRDLENQGTGYIIEMSQSMLTDVIETGGLAPLVDYVKRYCDVIDGPEDAERITAEILAAE